MGKLNTVQNGKGSKPRPIKDVKKYNDNWDEIFSKKDKKKLAKETENEDTQKTYETSTNSL